MTDSSTPFSALPRLEAIKTLDLSVYETLKAAIMMGKLAPGQKLATAKIAEKLGVSRMPVREAIHRLAVEGFVTVKPHRGAVVTELSWRDVEEIYNIRMTLEGYAMKLAVDRVTDRQIEALETLLKAAEGKMAEGNLDEIQAIDDRFHRTLFSTCGSERLIALLTNLWDQSVYFRSVAALLRKDLSLSLRQHQELIDALRARDPARAVKAVQSHTQVARDTLVDHLKAKEAGRDTP